MRKLYIKKILQGLLLTWFLFLFGGVAYLLMLDGEVIDYILPAFGRIFIQAILGIIGLGLVYKLYLKLKNSRNKEETKISCFCSYFVTSLAVLSLYIPIIIASVLSLEHFWGGERCEGFCEYFAVTVAFVFWIIPIGLIIKIKPFTSNFLRKK